MLFKHALLLFRVKGDVGGEEVHQVEGVVDVLHRKSQVTPVVAHIAQHAHGHFDNGLQQHLKLLITG